MQPRGLYRKMTPAEVEAAQFRESQLDTQLESDRVRPKVRPVKPPKGAKRKAKR